MLDLLGQEIQVRDLVVGGTSSSFTNYGKPHVVTRLGSTNKVQLNGGSYANAELLVKVTQQYAHHAGQEMLNALLAEYAGEFIEEPAKKAKQQNRYVVLAIRKYGEPSNRVRKYLIVEVCGSMQEKRAMFDKATKEICGVVNNELLCNYPLRIYPEWDYKNQNYNEYYGFSSSTYTFYDHSLKVLKTFGLSDWIGQVIDPEHPGYATMQAFAHH